MKSNVTKILEKNQEYATYGKEEVTNVLLKEVIEQLKLANSTLEEIHEELHEFTNRGGY